MNARYKRNIMRPRANSCVSLSGGQPGRYPSPPPPLREKRPLSRTSPREINATLAHIVITI